MFMAFSQWTPELLVPTRCVLYGHNSYCGFLSTALQLSQSCRVIAKYKSCPLNETKLKTRGHALGVMWSFINDGQCLENAHNSMVDAKAQSDVLTDARFVPFSSLRLWKVFLLCERIDNQDYTLAIKESKGYC